MNLTFYWCVDGGEGVSGLNGEVMVITITDTEGKYIQHCCWGMSDCLRVRKMDVGICWILHILVLNTYGCWDFKN